MLRPYLQLLLTKAPLTQKLAEEAMTLILEGADPHQTSAFLAILKYRGETAVEVAGMVQALQKKATPVSLPFPVLDIVGTGGDMAKTVNISTASAILAAGCGIPIAKHGNRSVSSQSGSADVLEAFGLNIEVQPEDLTLALQTANIAFMFAPFYHPALKAISPVRRGLKLPTVFNMLGPLLNPAKAEYALIGVAQESQLELMSKVLLQLGHVKRALVFHGCGLDELTTLGPIKAYHLFEGKMEFLEIDPEKLGFTRSALTDLQGGDAQTNALILKRVFEGEVGAIADALILNAAAALFIFGRALSLEEAIPIARQALKEGKALEVLTKWKQPQNYLEQIVVRKKQEVAQLISDHSKHFSAALKGPELSIIGEIKRQSPSVGKIDKISDPVHLAQEYFKGGVSAISVLTDDQGFGGTLADLAQVSQKLPCPTLRKDFIIHPLQLVEAIKAGADAVLLIANILGENLKPMILEANRLGLETLTEVHELADLELALEAGAPIIGINNRNLKTFQIDLNISKQLRPLIPSHIITVSESGIHTPEQAQMMRALGFDAILVGEALVRALNPAELIEQMKRGPDGS